MSKLEYRTTFTEYSDTLNKKLEGFPQIEWYENTIFEDVQSYFPSIGSATNYKFPLVKKSL